MTEPQNKYIVESLPMKMMGEDELGKEFMEEREKILIEHFNKEAKNIKLGGGFRVCQKCGTTVFGSKVHTCHKYKKEGNRND